MDHQGRTPTGPSRTNPRPTKTICTTLPRPCKIRSTAPTTRTPATSIARPSEPTATVTSKARTARSNLTVPLPPSCTPPKRLRRFPSRDREIWRIPIKPELDKGVRTRGFDLFRKVVRNRARVTNCGALSKFIFDALIFFHLFILKNFTKN